jgi:hypothetical protein
VVGLHPGRVHAEHPVLGELNPPGGARPRPGYSRTADQPGHSAKKQLRSNLDPSRPFQLRVDEEPIICAFTLAELEWLIEWGEGETDLEPKEHELLERIKRVVAAARERERPGPR